MNPGLTPEQQERKRMRKGTKRRLSKYDVYFGLILGYTKEEYREYLSKYYEAEFYYDD